MFKILYRSGKKNSARLSGNIAVSIHDVKGEFDNYEKINESYKMNATELKNGKILEKARVKPHPLKMKSVGIKKEEHKMPSLFKTIIKKFS
ncbi:MAG: hypothetical protein BWY78_00813 [Alphaproteobacteria bacterium ADurb.Bin438]|nr:MAG: hypothetical protein BWY78_00813 [Alphaproteobacteria bacterium ADurb.Bin438]